MSTWHFEHPCLNSGQVFIYLPTPNTITGFPRAPWNDITLSFDVSCIVTGSMTGPVDDITLLNDMPHRLTQSDNEDNNWF